MTDFPVFTKHTAVKCFNCHRRCSGRNPQRSGWPHGAWVQYCPTCMMRTWYDLQPRHTPQPRANLRLLDQGEWQEGDDSVAAFMRGRG